MSGVHHGPLPGRTRRTIGVLSPVVGGFYFGAVIAGVARACRAGGHRVVAVQTYPAGLDREGAAEPGNVPVALDAVDGLVVISKALPVERLAEVERRGIPLVLVSEDVPFAAAPMVLPDNAGGVRASVEHLLKHGHHTIGFVGCLTQRDMRERFAAYRETLVGHGIEPDPTWVYDATDNNEAGGMAAARKLLAAGSPTTAVVVATDRNAAGFQLALRQSGLQLPRDQAVVAFDHADFGARISPRLSTVDAHFDRVGETAVRLLLARLRGESVPPVEHRTPTTLVVRESCGCTPLGRLEGPAADWQEDIRQLATSSFIGAHGVPADHPERVGPQQAWARAVVEPLSAARAGVTPPDASMQRLTELTAALQPYPDALEHLIASVRRAQHSLAEQAEAGAPSGALERAATEVLLALTRGCTTALLQRSGRLETTVVHQYEVAMDLLRGDGANPRTLEWLPRGMRGRACLALWSGATGDVDRPLEIVGVRDASGALARLVGTQTTAAEFPPAAMLRGSPTSEATFVVPVTCGRSDWGLLAVEGVVEWRATAARDRFNHWAALLAVALDQQSLLASLQEQREALEQSAARERALADAVRVSEEHYALASMAADDGTWDWDVSAGSVYYSPRWKQTLGYEEDEVGDSPSDWLERVHLEDRDEVSTAIAAALAGVDATLELEHRVRTASGSYRWLLCRAMTVLDDAGCPARLVGTIVDVTQRKQAELSQQRDALQDAETGLATRLLFLDRLGASLVRAHRLAEYDCSLVVVRLRPEVVGVPTQGPGPHTSTVHTEVARRLHSAVRAGDTAARTADDEIALLLEDTGGDGVPQRVRRLLERLHEEFGDRVRIGVLASVRTHPDVADVMREVDIALARAGSRASARTILS